MWKSSVSCTASTAEVESPRDHPSMMLDHEEDIIHTGLFVKSKVAMGWGKYKTYEEAQKAAQDFSSDLLKISQFKAKEEFKSEEVKKLVEALFNKVTALEGDAQEFEVALKKKQQRDTGTSVNHVKEKKEDDSTKGDEASNAPGPVYLPGTRQPAMQPVPKPDHDDDDDGYGYAWVGPHTPRGHPRPADYYGGYGTRVVSAVHLVLEHARMCNPLLTTLF